MTWTIMGWFSVATLTLGGLIIVADNDHKGRDRVVATILDGIVVAYILHTLLT